MLEVSQIGKETNIGWFTNQKPPEDLPINANAEPLADLLFDHAEAVYAPKVNASMGLQH